MEGVLRWLFVALSEKRENREIRAEDKANNDSFLLGGGCCDLLLVTVMRDGWLYF